MLGRWQAGLLAVAVIGASFVGNGAGEARAGAEVSPHAPEAPLNVLFITADDLGLQLGAYGDEVAVTPNMDELAASGVQFNTAYVAQASCSSSRSAMFTGLYVHTNGQYGLTARSPFQLHPDLHDAVMPTILKRAGYYTGMLGKLHVQPEDAFQFDERVHGGGRDVRSVAAFADQFMKNAAAEGKPFFLLASSKDPHVERLVDPETGELGPAFFPDQVDGLPETLIQPSKLTLLPFQGVDSREHRVRVAGYYNAVQRLDIGVGMLLDVLEENGHADDTLVILIGDHGPAFDRAKTTVYEAGLRVPFLVRWPGVSKPTQSDALVSSVDILPTVLDAAQVEPVVPLQGESLRSIINNPDAEWRQYLVGEHHMHTLPFYPRRSIRDDRYKLIHNLLSGTLKPRIAGTAGDDGYRLSRARRYDGTDVRQAFDTAVSPPQFELYDLQTDPWEFKNLAGQEEYREVQERLTQALTEWRETTADPFLDPAFLAEMHMQLNGPSLYGTCAGLSPTITGSPEDDVIFGTDGPDVIVGLDGDDRIFGRGGDDVICGNGGADVLVGHDGADHLIGGLGPDRLYGRSGPDVLEGSNGADLLLGGGGGDELLGGEGDDVIRGGPGTDHLDGGAGTDILNGGGGLDVLTDTPGTYPHPRVGLGTDGWLYLADEFVQPCENTVPHRDIAATANRIARIVAASGRTPIVLLAPAKDAIHPEHLGDLAGDAACAAERRRELRTAFRRAEIPGWIDMWSILRRRALVEETYSPLNSHWTTLGGLLATKQAVTKLEPGLWSWQEVTTSQSTVGGDLAIMVGSTASFPVTVYQVDRGATVTQLDTEGRDGPNRYEATAPGGVAAVDLFMVHDSFGNPVERMLSQYTGASTFANWSVFSNGADRYDRLAEMVAAHDVFVIESGERGSYRRFGRTFVPLAPALIRALADDLPGNAVDLGAATGSGWTIDSGNIVPTTPDPVVNLPVLPAIPPRAHRYLTVTVIAGSEDPVQLRTETGGLLSEGAPQQMISGSTHVLVWDLTAAGGPRVLTLLPNAATITAAAIVDIP